MMGGSGSRIAAGVGAALFVGYCIYFDRKRRSDPNYKNKLRERESIYLSIYLHPSIDRSVDLMNVILFQEEESRRQLRRRLDYRGYFTLLPVRRSSSDSERQE